MAGGTAMITAITWAFKQQGITSSTKFVLVALADYASKENQESFPSIQTLCKKTSLNRKTILASIARLIETGYIRDTGRRKGRTKSIPVYQLLLSRNSPENGTDKQSRKRDTEPSVFITVNGNGSTVVLPSPHGEEKTPRLKPSEQGSQLAQMFSRLLPKNRPQLKKNWEEEWARTFDDLMRIDGRTIPEIEEVCRWARGDDFWARNFLSPLKLRRRDRDGTMYYDVFLLAKGKRAKSVKTAEEREREAQRRCILGL
jgi:Helix-turn-helix domain